MFTTIKAQLALYKWGFIVFFISALVLTATVQCHQNKNLSDELSHANERAVELNSKIAEISNSLIEYRLKTDKALGDIEALRTDFSATNKVTEGLRKELKTRTPPAKNGENSVEIEKEANKISTDVFKRIEEAMK
jgi:predicted  nucleic acid-binding Zn-ribbon protein